MLKNMQQYISNQFYLKVFEKINFLYEVFELEKNGSVQTVMCKKVKKKKGRKDVFSVF